MRNSLRVIFTRFKKLLHTVSRLYSLSYSVDLLSRATFIRSWMHHCAYMPLSCSPHKRTMPINGARLIHHWCTRAFSHPCRRREYYPKTAVPFRSPHSIGELFCVPLPGEFVINIIRYSPLPFVLILGLVYSFDYKLFLLDSKFTKYYFVLLELVVWSFWAPLPFFLSNCLILDFRCNSRYWRYYITENTLPTVHLKDFDILTILLIQTKTEKRNCRRTD